MRRLATLLVVALAFGSTACIVERGEVRPDPEVSAAPPPPASDSQSEYQSDYQAEAPPPPPGSEVDDVSVFYTDLSPWGSWTYVAPYGRVWIPAVGYGWRPYYYGRWVLTDWGWTFVSDDPWGWAAYHYGRWNWGLGIGWYWIPGHVWGPAWVSWRFGGGYAAWCPLGPSGVYFGYRHPAWVAVPQQHFTRPIRSVAVPVRATAGVVHATQPLTGVHATPTARSGSFGPPVASIQRAVGQPIARVPATQVVGQPRASGAAPRAQAGPMRSPISPRARTGGDRAAEPGRPAPRPYAPGRSAGEVTPRPYGPSRTGGPVAPRPYGGGGGRGSAGNEARPHAGGGAPAPRGGGAAPAPRGDSAPRAAPAQPAPKAHPQPRAQERDK